MPNIVEQLTKEEEILASEIKNKFTEQEMGAYFLTKTIRSQYQFDDEFIRKWYIDIFGKEPIDKRMARPELIQSYTTMLLFEKKYIYHLRYWLREYQEGLMIEMTSFFSGKAGK